ncbi:glycosyltransferase family 2 protein [Candidatus Parcubacteria bacterium]|nr:MAG: glycosyltransferase family 2 protein [Candidatus Parcubacteria bacterium]
MDVSIVIPTYNRIFELKKCINTLLVQKSIKFEIIIIDDASKDQTANILAKEFPGLIVIRNSHNLGPAYSRNVGINVAKGNFILFLDSDAVFDNETALQNFLQFFKTHNNVGSVGGELRAYEKNDTFIFGKKILCSGNSRDQPIINIPGSFAQCDFLATCCCMIKKETATRVGGFDPYYGFGGEDKDLGFRITRLGLKNYVSADCAARHFHSLSGKSVDETFKYHMTRIRFGLKCFSFSRKIVLLFGVFFKCLFFYAIFPFKVLCYFFLNRPLVKENFLGGWLMLKALLQNLKLYRLTKECRTKNHLSQEEIAKYVSYMKSIQAKS